PDRLREAEDEDGVVGDRGDRRVARRVPTVALEEDGGGGHHQRRQQRHPEHDGQRRRGYARAPHLLRAERPDGGGDEHADGGPRPARDRVELVPEQQRDAGRRGDDADHEARPEPLAEGGDAPERREDRHRVAEDGGPPRRQRLHGDEYEHRPDDHAGG